MLSHAFFQRRHAFALLVTGLTVFLIPVLSHAQTNVPTLFLRPHCEAEDQSTCALFDVQDPLRLITEKLAEGDTLDVDLVLSNVTQEAISKIRVWLSYDAEALEGTSVDISPTFPTVVPGQSDFSPLSGYAKIAASAAAGKEPTDAILPIARLTFTVKSSAKAKSTPLSFYDQRSGIEGHTFVATVTSPAENLLANPLGTLLVQLSAPAAEQSSSVRPEAEAGTQTAESGSSAAKGATTAAPVSATTVSSSSASSAAPQKSFALIQVQNVRVGTKDNLLYVTWDPLSHPKLQGYNVYYGTLRGRYLQRRSVSLASRGVAIRDLPQEKTYFVAVRGVDDQNQETAFSTEASVEIGNQATAAPSIIGDFDALAELPGEDIAPPNPVEDPARPLDAGVPGKSGSPSALVLLLLGSAAIGTLLAVRRQAIAAKTLPL